ITLSFLFVICLNSDAQVVCETGYFADYSCSGHLIPNAITTLRNGHQIISGTGNANAADKLKGMVARVSETGDIVWSFTMDAGEEAQFSNALEKANGQYIVYGKVF